MSEQEQNVIPENLDDNRCPATNCAETGGAIPGDESCKLGLIWRRVNVYMQKRHDEIFGTDWMEQFVTKSKEYRLTIR
jgi:hypothetical protein